MTSQVSKWTWLGHQHQNLTAGRIAKSRTAELQERVHLGRAAREGGVFVRCLCLGIPTPGAGLKEELGNSSAKTHAPNHHS